MKSKVFQQSICTDCLQLLVNGESDHAPEELVRMNKTLAQWADSKYVPAGMHTDENGNCEPSFSWHRCDLCNGLAGDRYQYDFFQNRPDYRAANKSVKLA